MWHRLGGGRCTLWQRRRRHPPQAAPYSPVTIADAYGRWTGERAHHRPFPPCHSCTVLVAKSYPWLSTHKTVTCCCRRAVIALSGCGTYGDCLVVAVWTQRRWRRQELQRGKKRVVQWVRGSHKRCCHASQRLQCGRLGRATQCWRRAETTGVCTHTQERKTDVLRNTDVV